MRRSRKGGRLRRWLLYLGLPPVLLLLVLVIFRNPLARFLVPRIVGSQLGVELHVEALSIGLGGRIEARGVESKDPADWARVRSLRFREAELDLHPLDLLPSNGPRMDRASRPLRPPPDVGDLTNSLWFDF